ncbi:MAG: DSD1 family PLP-dependent enzyme [Alcaligenaceae bacterium]|nr:DSD1 family PLP-dependent enzyme [Alcaligenaceae bacterium]
MDTPTLIQARARLARINEHLLGKPGGRSQIDTPALVLDLDALEKNIGAMADYAATRNMALRPHGKTHKCPEIARRQIAAGAIGICCAKTTEVEAFAAEDIPSILLTAPVADPRKLERLARARKALGELYMVVDDPAHVDACEAVARLTQQTVNVLIDMDVGQHRTGVVGPEAVVALARRVIETKGLTLAGLQAYAGQLQHIVEVRERESQARAVLAQVTAARDALLSNGMACGIVSGSGTGTFDIDAEAQVYTELQVGSYVFMDAHYHEVRQKGAQGPTLVPALFVATQVISNRHPGFVTTDAGSKSMALDGSAPWVSRGAPQGCAYRTSGDQFGRAVLPDSGSLPLGARLELVPPHCDPTVNLYEMFHCVRGDVIEALWKIAGGAVS